MKSRKIKSLLVGLAVLLVSTSISYGAQQWVPNMYQKTISAEMTSTSNIFPTTKQFTVDGYTGDLLKKGASTTYVVSGSYTPPSTERVTYLYELEYCSHPNTIIVGGVTYYKDTSFACYSYRTGHTNYNYRWHAFQQYYADIPKPAIDTRVYGWKQMYEGIGYKGSYNNIPELTLTTPENNSYFKN